MAEPISKRDLEFMLYEWLDVESLTERERFAEHSRDTFDAVLELAADLATKRFAPVNRLGDTQEPYVGDDGAVVGDVDRGAFVLEPAQGLSLIHI